MVGSTAILKRRSTGLAALRPRGQVGLMLAAILAAVSLMHLAWMMKSSARRNSRGPGRLSALRRAIVGAGKRQIAAVLGPPRATIGRGNYLTDNTWYYPLDRRQRTALAIEFDNDVACVTQVIAGAGRSRPQLSSRI